MMRCNQFRKMTGTPDSVSGELQQLSPPLREHIEMCPDCRRWLAHTRAVSKMVRDLPAGSPSAGFTAAVMAGLTANRPGLLKRLLQRIAGPLRAPAPLVPAYQLVAAGCILLVIIAGGAFYGIHLSPAATPPDTAIGLVAADGTTPGMAHTPVAIGTAHNALQPVHARSDTLPVEDLVLSHDTYELSRPLGSDPGIRLVRQSAK
jgi:hypothetical protein